jgi:regulator of sigma E protease
LDPIYLISFIIILSILVFVHELGHFVIAKRSGITVEEFALGFPPRLVKLWQDEGSITLDGHEFIIGRKLNVPRTIQPGAQIYAETGIDQQGRPEVTKLELVTPPGKGEASQSGSEAKFFNLLSRGSASTPAGDRAVVTVEALTRPTEYTINWIPFGGYVRMVGEEDPSAPGSFASKSKRARLAVLAAGSLMNLVAAIFFFTLAAMSGTPEPVTGTNLQGEEAPVAKTVINEVIADTPASQADLQAGDIIVGAEGVEFNHVGDLVAYIEKNKGTEITLNIDRKGQIIQAALTPRANPPANQGAMGVGISYEGIENTLTYLPVHQALASGVSQTARYVALTFYMPIAILQNIFPAEAARPTGPVGIYQQTGSAVNAAITLNWWFPVLWFTAVLSTALAVTNLLPLPALDGGRILFIIIEAIRGKRVPPEKEGAIHFVGLALLVTLMLVISYYDISSPIPPIDWNSFF